MREGKKKKERKKEKGRNETRLVARRIQRVHVLRVARRMKNLWF